MTIHPISTSIRSMGKGSWAVLAVLLMLLVGTIFVPYPGWTSASGTDVPSSGYVALALGVIFSLIVGFGAPPRRLWRTLQSLCWSAIAELETKRLKLAIARKLAADIFITPSLDCVKRRRIATQENSNFTWAVLA
jgi:hypothetical protein